MKKTISAIIFTIYLLLSSANIIYAQTNYSGTQISSKTSFHNNDGIVINTLSSQMADGVLNVQAQIQNNSGRNLHVYYRFFWHNSAGDKIAESTWKPILLMPGKTQLINGTAPLKTVIDFHLELNTN